MRRLRRLRAARIRSARVARRRGGPTATGFARSRPQSSGITALSVRGRGGAPLIQPALQDADGRDLIDHGPLTLGANAGLPQRPLRGHGGQPLVGQPHRGRRDAPGQQFGEIDGILRGLPRSVSASVRGRPTTTSTASNSLTSCASRRRCSPGCGPGARSPPAWPECRPGRWWPRRCERCPRRHRAVVRVRGRRPRADPATVFGIGHVASSGHLRAQRATVPRRYPPAPYRNPVPDRPCRPRGRRRPHPVASPGRWRAGRDPGPPG